MTTKWYTLSGAAEYKGTTYPTVRSAVNAATKTGLSPTKANVGLKDAREVELLSKEQLDAWTPIRRTRLTEDERLKRAAKMAGVTFEQMKAALKGAKKAALDNK